MNLITNNRKAYFEYYIHDTFEAGIVLEGSEVKSLRRNGFNLQDSFVYIKDNEIYLKNSYIKPYEKTAVFALDGRRDRKLLLNKKEIQKLIRETKEKGRTIVATKVYFKGSFVKLEIASATGKKLYDKRETIKQKDIKRDMERDTIKY